MKRIFTLLLLATALGAQAQVRFHAGGGIGTSGMSDIESSHNRLSYRVGGGADIHIGPFFSIRPAVYFSQKGTDFDGFYGSEQKDEAKFTVSTNYLDIPLLAGFDIRLRNHSAIVLTVGPQLSCGLSGKAKVKFANSDAEQKFSTDVFKGNVDFHGAAENTKGNEIEVPEFNKWELGIMLGAAYEMRHFRIGVALTQTITESAKKHIEVLQGNSYGQYGWTIAGGSTSCDFFYDMTTPRNHTLHLTFDYIF